MTAPDETPREPNVPQHTPGPWHRCEVQPDAIVGPHCEDFCEQCDRAQLSHYDDEGHSVYLGETYGEYFGGHFVCESVSSTANFNLITAAPHLLAACEEAAAWLGALGGTKVTEALASKCRMAATKARGGQ